MSRKFISLIVAASIAVTGLTAAPAQANERDLARALATIAGVAIVGVAINEASKKKRRAAQRRFHQQPQFHQQPKYHAKRKHGKKHGKKHARQRAHDRAYRQDLNDHRSHVRERRSERRGHQGGRGGQEYYSARPQRH